MAYAGKPDGKHVVWLCRCECGANHVTRGDILTRGLVLSCGCGHFVLTHPELFWNRVVRVPSGCWEWTGSRRKRVADGVATYGYFQEGGRVFLAHRFSYEINVGPIPDGLLVLHRCDNPPCVNPVHLFVGSHDDNMADKAAKGRAPQGEDVWTAVLTTSFVREARARHAAGETVPELAAAFGLSYRAMLDAVTGRSWKGVR